MTRLTRRIPLWLAGFLLSLCCALPVRAQHPLVIKVYLEGCNAAHEVSIAIDSHDHPLVLLEKKPDNAYWSGTWTDNRGKGSLREAPLYASVRVDAQRTYCRKATPGKADNDADAAEFSFDCEENPTQSIVVDARKDNEGEAPYDYVRHLRAPDRPGLDRPCDEGAQRQGRATIRNIRVGEETLRLQFSKTLSELEPSTVKLPLHLQGTEEVISAFVRQRARGEQSPPVLSPLSIDLDDKSVRKIGLQRLDVQVQK